MPAPVRLEALLPRFICGDPEVASEFDQVARPVLTKFAKRFGWFLPDQHEDIVQQALLLLIGPAGRKFDPRRSSAEVFLRLTTRRATREVAATHAVPGSRTRPPKRGSAADANPAARIVPLEDVAEDEAPAVEGPDWTVELQHDAAVILAAAPAAVARALSRIYLEDVSLTVVANEMNTSRFALGRAIAKFAGFCQGNLGMSGATP